MPEIFPLAVKPAQYRKEEKKRVQQHDPENRQSKRLHEARGAAPKLRLEGPGSVWGFSGGGT